MNIIKYILGTGMLCGLLLFVSSCNINGNNNPSLPSENDSSIVKSLGEYYFDNQKIEIKHGSWSEDDYRYVFVFTPLDRDTALSTYFLIAIAKALTGEVQNVEYISHNDDYHFVYEDPCVLYSSTKKLRSGTIYVEKTDENEFIIRFSATLFDGKKFDFDFQGELPKKGDFE